MFLQKLKRFLEIINLRSKNFILVNTPSGPEEEAEKSRLLNAEQDKVRDQRIIEEKSRIRNNSKSG